MDPSIFYQSDFLKLYEEAPAHLNHDEKIAHIAGITGQPIPRIESFFASRESRHAAAEVSL